MTYSVVLPRDHPLVAAGTTASYERIHRTLHQAILEIGVNVQVAETADIEESHSCFLKAARFDLKQGERKIAGAAQRRSREGCLHQGSVLLENVDRVKLAGAIERLLGFMLAEKSEESVMTDEERALTQELERTRYATQQWNHAR
jgi:lipoate-protein ligase A